MGISHILRDLIIDVENANEPVPLMIDLAEAAEQACDEIDDICSGKTVVVPKSRKHAEAMYSVALAYIHSDISSGGTQ